MPTVPPLLMLLMLLMLAMTGFLSSVLVAGSGGHRYA
jgi:hypothetical protein